MNTLSRFFRYAAELVQRLATVLLGLMVLATILYYWAITSQNIDIARKSTGGVLITYTNNMSVRIGAEQIRLSIRLTY